MSLFTKAQTIDSKTIEWQLKDGTVVKTASNNPHETIKYYYTMGFIPLSDGAYTPVSRVEKVVVRE